MPNKPCDDHATVAVCWPCEVNRLRRKANRQADIFLHDLEGIKEAIIGGAPPDGIIRYIDKVVQITIDSKEEMI